MRKLGGGCEDDLPEDIDEAVFADANAASIDIVPMKVQDGATSQDEEVIAVSGTTFPFKDWLKTKGFSFANTVNGHEGAQLWLAPKDEVDTSELAAYFEEYGFAVEVFDRVDEE